MTNEEILKAARSVLFSKSSPFSDRQIICMMNAARKNERKPPFIVAEVREYLNQLLNEDITFSRFVELLNTRPKMQKK